MATPTSDPIRDPRDWDARYAAKDTPWDMGQPSPPLVAFQREGILPRSKRVLIPGCGHGHEVLYLAANGYEVVGADISPLAAARARERVRSQPHAEIICVDLLDEKATRKLAPVDWAFDQTFFCALTPDRRPDWAQALKRRIRPGGELWTLAFVTGDQDHQPFDSPPEAVLAAAALGGFSPLAVRTLQSESHPARCGRETLLRLRRN